MDISLSQPSCRLPRELPSCRKSISAPFSSSSATQLWKKPLLSITVFLKAFLVVCSLKTWLTHSDGWALMGLIAAS